MRCRTRPFCGGSVKVWAGIRAQGKTNLHIIENGTLTTVRYVNEVLDVHVRTYAGAVGPDFILMDDSFRTHWAHITIRYLEEATIVRMDWPARSPDWACLGYAADNHFFTPLLTNNSSGAKTCNHRGMGQDSSSQGLQAHQHTILGIQKLSILSICVHWTPPFLVDLVYHIFWHSKEIPPLHLDSRKSS
jgi:hypothetical protein